MCACLCVCAYVCVKTFSTLQVTKRSTIDVWKDRWTLKIYKRAT